MYQLTRKIADLELACAELRSALNATARSEECLAETVHHLVGDNISESSARAAVASIVRSHLGRVVTAEVGVELARQIVSALSGLRVGVRE